MPKIGYYYNPLDDGQGNQNLEQFARFDCKKIFIDKKEHEQDRPQWRQLLVSLQSHDVLFLYKLSNAVRGVREFSFFLQIVKEKSIRLISILDEIDTKGVYFPSTTISDVLDVIADLPNEISSIRHINDMSPTVSKVIYSNSNNRRKRRKRHSLVINMYNGGYTIPEIIHQTGYKSKSTIFHILKKYAIETNRKVCRYKK